MASSCMIVSLSASTVLLVTVVGYHNSLQMQSRDGKQFKLPFFPFIIDEVNPVPCNTTHKEIGACYKKDTCFKKGGKKDGTCASGYGVCCKFEHECGAIVKTNVSHLVNNGYPNSFKGISNCQYTINKLNDNICQLRLDFEKFKLAQPDEATSQCLVDTFTAFADGSNSVEICGDNDGQHIYLDVADTSMNTRINIVTRSSSDAVEREWRIKVTQIDCSSKLRAPKGCFQYFDSYVGDIMSFNYDKIASDSPGLRQLGNMNYAVCVNAKEGFCGIKYTAVESTGFSLSGDQTIAAAIASDDSACTKDYIMIPASDGTEKDRFCGTKLDDITTSAKPFIVRVVTDNTELPAADKDNKGFSLSFSQVPCMAAGMAVGRRK